jgi:hypothetical protein
MPGFADFEPSPAPLDRDAVPIVVYRLTTDELNEGGTYELMPNIRAMRIERRLGAKLGRAVLQYILDATGTISDPAWPTTPEQVLRPGAKGRYILAQDDRVVIGGITEDGVLRMLFDGFVNLPRGAVGPKECVVEFSASPTPIRCWDEPVWGRVQRSADDRTNAVLNSVLDLPVIFNPDGEPNATEEDDDGKLPWEDSVTTPMFLDEVACKSRDFGRHWSLAMAVRYLMATYNDNTWVSNGSLSTNDDLLDGIVPLDPSGDFDPDDDTTFTAAPIVVREYDATGVPWPEAVEHLLTQYGFQFQFHLQADPAGLPSWLVKIFRVADAAPETFERVYLQDYGSDLDPALTNATAFQLERDAEPVKNELTVYGRPGRVEVSAVLAPGYIPDAADATPAELARRAEDSLAKGLSSGGDDDRDNALYRDYVFDETGDGHWDWESHAWKPIGSLGTSLAAVLSPRGPDESAYARRRRPGRRDLLSKDDNEDPRPSLLLLSTDYKGPVPGVWDGTGTWFEVGHSWKLLTDRLGVHLTAASIEAWQTGNDAISFGKGLKSMGGIVKGVSAQAIPTETHFHLMLVTVIEGDSSLMAEAPRRGAAPGKFDVKQYVDASQRYARDVISKNSWWNYPDPGADPVVSVARDDGEDAKYDAGQKRSLLEMPPITGSIPLFGLSNTYELGDRVAEIEGRDLSLRTNAGATGEAPAYPLIVQIDYVLDGRQETVLHLHDQRGLGRGMG